jgi:hypothetical protein
MGKRKRRERQEGLWVAQTELASAPGHPFYQKLNELLEAEGPSSLSRGAADRVFRGHELPLDESAIDWRVTNTAKGEQRGQVVPYADPRAYTDRLNALLTPAGWRRKYAVHTSGGRVEIPYRPPICPGGEVRVAKLLKEMVGTRRLELLTSTVSR